MAIAAASRVQDYLKATGPEKEKILDFHFEPKTPEQTEMEDNGNDPEETDHQSDAEDPPERPIMTPTRYPSWNRYRGWYFFSKNDKLVKQRPN